MTTERGLALVFVYGVFLVLSDFDSTAQLAAALALVVMTTILIAYGEAAIKNVQKLTTPASGVRGSSTVSGGGGSGGHSVGSTY